MPGLTPLRRDLGASRIGETAWNAFPGRYDGLADLLTGWPPATPGPCGERSGRLAAAHRLRGRATQPLGPASPSDEPVEFLAKLAALIPPPRKHLTRYHGVFAPNHAWRSRIVPTVSKATASTPSEESTTAVEAEERVPATELARRLDWATLLMHVFAIDVLECPKCEGRMRVLALITEPDVIERILSHLDLPTTPLSSSRGLPPAWRVAG